MTILRSTTPLAEIALPPAPRGDHGSKWSTDRAFNADAITAPATPQQEAAMAEIDQILADADDPAAVAASVLERIEEERAAKGCDLLDGQCQRHTDDHGEIIHRGQLHRASGGEDDNLLTHGLMQWNDDEPRLEFIGGGYWPDLGLPEADTLIAAVEKQLASLRDCRAHLAAALGEAPPTQPPEHQNAQTADGSATGTAVQA